MKARNGILRGVMTEKFKRGDIIKHNCFYFYVCDYQPNVEHYVLYGFETAFRHASEHHRTWVENMFELHSSILREDI